MQVPDDESSVVIGSGVAAVHVTADVTDAASVFLQQMGADSHSGL